MTPTDSLLARFPPPRCCLTRTAYRAQVRASFEAAGVAAVDVTELVDRGGNCLVCGEAGRCPGWHTAEEVQAATAPELFPV